MGIEIRVLEFLPCVLWSSTIHLLKKFELPGLLKTWLSVSCPKQLKMVFAVYKQNSHE